jgi:hypothetical protein
MHETEKPMNAAPKVSVSLNEHRTENGQEDRIVSPLIATCRPEAAIFCYAWHCGGTIGEHGDAIKSLLLLAMHFQIQLRSKNSHAVQG